MAAKLTRRRLALAAVPLAAVPLLSQATAPAQNTDPADDITAQRENLLRWREQMAKVKLPISAEPAFIFKA